MRRMLLGARELASDRLKRLSKEVLLRVYHHTQRHDQQSTRMQREEKVSLPRNVDSRFIESRIDVVNWDRVVRVRSIARNVYHDT